MSTRLQVSSDARNRRLCGFFSADRHIHGWWYAFGSLGVATQLKEVMTPEFKEYAKQVKKNAQAVAAALISKGYSIALVALRTICFCGT